MLEISQVTKQYPTPRGPLTVLDGVSLSMKRGESAAIMGPSGVGKSTLLYIAGGLEPPTSGQVTLDGSDPHRLGDKDLAEFRNRKVGFLFQEGADLIRHAKQLGPLFFVEGDGEPA